MGADPERYTVFYVNNTTDGLNKLASALIRKKSDLVLTTRIEHHSNDLPWRENGTVIYAEVDDQGRVIYDDIEKLLKKNKVKENIDFFVFSAHKMYSPFGGGAVVGLTDELMSHMPKFYGGGTIHIVGDEWVEYAEAPKSYEAGSPNYPGVVGLGKAIDILEEIGFEDIEAHEKALNQRLVDGLRESICMETVRTVGRRGQELCGMLRHKHTGYDPCQLRDI